MFAEDALIPVAGLQHVLYCERQFALIHLEQVWEENRYTAEGKVLHERVDVEHHENRRLFRQEYGLWIRSLRWGLVGKCDLVELHYTPEGGVAEALPVEFKRGKKKLSDVDRVQVCAQGLCLEEMMGISVPRAQFYYLQEHRRSTVDLDVPLREKTQALIGRVRQILEEGLTPPAEYESEKCDRCSLVDVCMPRHAGAGSKRVDRYVGTQIRRNRAEVF